MRVKQNGGRSPGEYPLRKGDRRNIGHLHVGVRVDQARDQIPALRIHQLFRLRAFSCGKNSGNHAVGDRHIPQCDRLQKYVHQIGIPDDKVGLGLFMGHVHPSFDFRDLCFQLHVFLLLIRNG